MGNSKLYYSNGTTSWFPPFKYKKLWYISQDINSTIYCAKINKASDAFVHAVTGTIMHNRWPHWLGQAWKFATDYIDKFANDVTSLRSHSPFFSCQRCSKVKINKMTKGFNKDSLCVAIPCRRMYMSYRFFRGETVTKIKDGLLITRKMVIISTYSL